MTKRIAILISGGGSNMVSLVEMLQRTKVGVPALVLSNVPSAGGLAKAAALGVPSACINHKDYNDRGTFDAALHRRLEDEGIDIVCLAGFMRILTEDFTRSWAGKMLNIHPSLLPKYTGLNTHARAIQSGDDFGGCSVHLVTAELDAGPVLGQAKVAIAQGDTADSLATKVLKQEHLLYPLVLERFLAGQTSPLFLEAEAG